MGIKIDFQTNEKSLNTKRKIKIIKQKKKNGIFFFINFLTFVFAAEQ